MKTKKKGKTKAKSQSLQNFFAGLETPSTAEKSKVSGEIDASYCNVASEGTVGAVPSTKSGALLEDYTLQNDLATADRSAQQVLVKCPEQAAHQVFVKRPEQAAHSVSRTGCSSRFAAGCEGMDLAGVSSKSGALMEGKTQQSYVAVAEKCARQVLEENPELEAPKVFGKSPQPNQQKKWTSLFPENRGSSKGMQLDYVEPSNDQVLIDDEDRQPLHNNWKFCLVGCFTGKFPGMQAVQSLTMTWGVKCTIVPYARGWIIFKFDCKEDRTTVLTKGPYKVFGKMLMLKVLSENFKYDKDAFLDVPVWIKFHGVPLDLWNKKGLSKIASRLGKPIQTDQITHEQQRLSYARVLVEVNLRKEPVKEFPVISASTNEVIYLQKIECENFPDYCYYCSRFSHGFEQCKRLGDLAKATDVVDDKVANDVRCAKEQQPPSIVTEERNEPGGVQNAKESTKKNPPKVAQKRGSKAVGQSQPTTATPTVKPKTNPPKAKEVLVPVKNSFTMLSEGESSHQEDSTSEDSEHDSGSSEDEYRRHVLVHFQPVPTEAKTREQHLARMMELHLEKNPDFAEWGAVVFQAELERAIEEYSDPDLSPSKEELARAWIPLMGDAYKRSFG